MMMMLNKDIIYKFAGGLQPDGKEERQGRQTKQARQNRQDNSPNDDSPNIRFRIRTVGAVNFPPAQNLLKDWLFVLQTSLS